MEIILYNKTCDNNYFDKTKYIKALGTINAEIPINFNVRNFTIITDNEAFHDFITANYVYIGNLNRYYYITHIDRHGDCLSINLQCDVLMSFKESIIKGYGTLVYHGGYIQGKYNSTAANTATQKSFSTRKVNFANYSFDVENPTNVLVTLKGDASINI